MNGVGTGNERDSENIIVNQVFSHDFAEPKKQVNVKHERDITEIQRYKNDEMITVREENLPWCAETMVL